MKGAVMLAVVVAGAVGAMAYLDVRKLPRGGTITAEDADGNPIVIEGEGGSWRYGWADTAKIWLFGRLP